MLNLRVPDLLTHLITLVIAITVHEFSHAKIADLFGDDTPRANGRVTLNPLAHLDPIGSILMLIGPLGWGRPVPVNPYALNRRSPAALMFVSLAGPCANLLLAVLAAVPVRLNWLSPIPPVSFLPSPYSFFNDFIFINLFLALFNLIPLAPLDGDKIADYFFPPSLGRLLEIIRPFGPLILMALLFLGPAVGFDFIGRFVYPPVSNLFNLLLG